MKTKLFILMLALVASVGTCQASIVTGTCGKNLTWAFNNKTGVLTIEGKGDMDFGNYSSPWKYREDITSVILPDGLTRIDAAAFYGCKNLTSITIPSSVKLIKELAFCKCISLTSIVIPNSVTGIGNEAFYGCTGLTSVTLPNGLDVIAFRAFSGCVRLRSITIPNSVTEIKDEAFASCRSLTSIVIPKNVTVLWPSAFEKCNITSFTIYAITPPSLKYEGYSLDRDKCTLYVPASAIETYSNSYYWEDFKAIKAIK